MQGTDSTNAHSRQGVEIVPVFAIPSFHLEETLGKQICTAVSLAYHNRFARPRREGCTHSLGDQHDVTAPFSGRRPVRVVQASLTSCPELPAQVTKCQDCGCYTDPDHLEREEPVD